MKNKDFIFETFLQESLNESQRHAVETDEGVMVIHAGAGSGKTRVITARITALIVKYGIDPTSILALTFTNKAAREMKDRVKKFLGNHGGLPFVGTFHSYCLRLLKSVPELTGFPEFTILDAHDQEKLVKQLALQKGVTKRLSAASILATISKIKNESYNGIPDYEGIADPILKSICISYEESKKNSRCFDFDDLLVVTLKIFKKHPHIKKNHQTLIRHILVDEYQDTNRVQHELIKEMSQDKKVLKIDSVCVVGDEDQSIYSWRGAVVTNMLNFKKDFSQTQHVTLEQNYRSVQTILDVAHATIVHNNQRHPKKLWSSRNGTDRVRILDCNSSFQEAEIIGLLAQHALKNKISLAVLYRSHYQSRSIEEALVRYALPYTIIGGIQFYNRMEIKDILSYLRLYANPYDRVAFMRAVTVPTRGLGDKFIEYFLARWDETPQKKFQEIAGDIIAEKAVAPSKCEALQEFVRLFKQCVKKTSDFVEYLIESTAYHAYLQRNYETQEVQERQENLRELIHAIRSMEEREQVTVTSFLESVALMQEQPEAENSEESIKLMTLHAAKGLEFSMVIIAGLEDGMLPHGRSIFNPEALEEERRLLYVGITRAQDYLLLLNAHHRYMYGQMHDMAPSRFLKELTGVSLRHDDASYWMTPEVQSYIKQWHT